MSENTDRHAISHMKWVPIEKVTANDYNPNSVAKNEMKLLYHSIKQDTYTQPIVTVYDPEKDIYIIVDGFHRYLVCKTFKDIYDSTDGQVPVVVISSDVNDRMASTIRHNRARGKHSVNGMSDIIFNMLENGWSDEQICNEIGLEAEELLRLKHVTGFSKLFENTEYRKSWMSRAQIKARKEAKEKGFKID